MLIVQYCYSYGERGLHVIHGAIGELFRSLEPKGGITPASGTPTPRPRPRRRQANAESMDLRPEYTARIAGLSLQDFTLVVLIPAVIIRLIQDDEEHRVGVKLTFEQAWEVAQNTKGVGDILFPDDDSDETPLNAEFIATKLAEQEDEGGSSN
jgi:hypothetical protein